MRHEVIDEISGQAALRAASSVKSQRIGLLWMSLWLFWTAPVAVAETARSIDLDGISPPAAMALLALAVEIPNEPALVESVRVEPDSFAPIIVDHPEEPELLVLEVLLTLRSSALRLPVPRTTDEKLAAAVALGTNPDLEPKNPFRKRSRDLFRTERPVTIGNADMIMRLRLRAKARRAMSVEFRF